MATNANCITLPPAAALESAARELTDAAIAAGDVKRQISINKAQYDLLMGAQIMRVSGAYLMPSSSRAGLVHRLDDLAGCDCEAGRAGKACRHRTALEIIELAQTRVMPALGDRLAAARKVADQFNAEIFG